MIVKKINIRLINTNKFNNINSLEEQNFDFNSLKEKILNQ